MIISTRFFVWPLLCSLLAVASCDPTGGSSKVNLSVDTEGSGSVDPSWGRYQTGATITITATPKSGWKFDRWKGDLTGSDNPASVLAMSDLDITAVFTFVPTNSAPTAQDLTVTTSPNVPVAFSLVGSDPDGGTVDYSGIMTIPKHGSFSFAPPVVTYIPAADYVGTDRLDYRVSDGEFDSSPATVNLIVAPTGLTGWARSVGGAAAEQANAVAVGSSGSVFVAGHFSGSIDFDPGKANAIHTATGGTDVFVAKFTADGDLEWIRTFGGTGDAVALCLAGDADGGAYLGGYFTGTVDFGTAQASDLRTSAGKSDAFVSRLSADGDQIWTQVYGADGDDRIHGAAVDVNDDVHVVGSFEKEVDFDLEDSVGGKHKSAGLLDGFVLKLDSDGAYQWSARFGGAGDDEVVSVCANDFGRATVAGYFSDLIDLDPSGRTILRASKGKEDIFLVQLTRSGGYVWSYAAGGEFTDMPGAVVNDAAGNIYVAGSFVNTVDFDSGSRRVERSSAGKSDAFLVRLNDAGFYQWSRTFGGSGDDQATALATDADGNAYIAGFFTQTADFDPQGSSEKRTANGGADIFLTNLTSAGAHVWTDTFGGSGDDSIHAITGAGPKADDPLIYAAGSFENDVDLNPDPNADQTHHAFSETDIFICKVRGDTGQW